MTMSAHMHKIIITVIARVGFTKCGSFSAPELRRPTLLQTHIYTSENLNIIPQIPTNEYEIVK